MAEARSREIVLREEIAKMKKGKGTEANTQTELFRREKTEGDDIYYAEDEMPYEVYLDYLYNKTINERNIQ